MYYANRSAILKWNLVRLGVDGNRKICGQRERAAGFSNVKSTAYIALEMVDKVHIDLQSAWVVIGQVRLVH